MCSFPRIFAIVGGGSGSFRASIFLCASATGAKFRPMIVFAGSPGFSVDDELRENPAFDWERAHFAVQRNAYCDELAMKQWVEQVWVPETEWVNLLLLDSFKVHKMATVRSMLETLSSTRVEYVPPGLTGVSQPMDVAVMKSFKNQCSNLYVQKITQGYEFATASNKRKLIAAVVVEAWERISSDTIRNGFLRAGLVSVGPRNQLGRFEVDPPHDTDVIDEEGEE